MARFSNGGVRGAFLHLSLHPLSNLSSNPRQAPSRNHQSRDQTSLLMSCFMAASSVLLSLGRLRPTTGVSCRVSSIIS
ncbi:hypothetical protein LX32DRAFT_306780 [Colletotrichum zoysiae]|uniref:Uncharacterized protein n=1 Tax=Colletotrichum zoysiae TaxID=1216348 RepID=A0AAD9M695_9PEZI|nr:hypothetical protein LX32DRAFT_306780 [Colletotrichum zoysiae]